MYTNFVLCCYLFSLVMQISCFVLDYKERRFKGGDFFLQKKQNKWRKKIIEAIKSSSFVIFIHVVRFIILRHNTELNFPPKIFFTYLLMLLLQGKVIATRDEDTKVVLFVEFEYFFNHRYHDLNLK